MKPKIMLMGLMGLIISLGCAALTRAVESTPVGLSNNPPQPTIEARPTLASAVGGAGPACPAYADGRIAFTCPPGWRIETDPQKADPLSGLDLGGEFITAAIDPALAGKYAYLRAVLFYRYPDRPGTDLEAFQTGIYATAEHFYPESWQERKLTLAGEEAIEACYRIYWGEPAYELCDFWLAHAGQFYRISARTQYTNPEDTAAALEAMQSLVESLRFED